MKTLKLHYLPILLIGSTSLLSYGQVETGKVWVTIENQEDVPVQKGERFVSSNPEIQKLIESNSVLSVEQALPDSRQEKLQKVYEVECWCNWEDLSAQMERTKGLTNPERAPEYELLADPDDYNTIFSNDYALDLINAKTAWDYSTGDPSTIIGVSDGNFFSNHEELQNNIVYLDAAYSYYSLLYYHGTAVATTAAGNTNNGLGKSSIGYDCQLALATMSYNKLLNLSYFGAKVINVSWASGCWYNSYLQAVIDEIYYNGTIIVAAAGNGGTCGGPTQLVYPAAFDHVIAVSSVGPQNNHERTIGNPNTTHQHNSSVDICAPGYDVALTVAPGWYLTGNGTSFAAPYVTGTIGLMLSIRPCLTFDDVLSILQSTAFDLDALNPNYAGMLGAGRMDAGLALKMTSEMSCYVDDGNNGHGNDDGNFDPSNPGQGNGPNGQGNGNGSGSGHGNGNNGQGGTGVSNPNGNSSITSSENSRSMTSEFDKFIVRMSPNPTSGLTNLEWDNIGPVEVIVTDVNGSIIYKESITRNIAETEFILDTKGLYFVHLKNSEGIVWTGKLVRT